MKKILIFFLAFNLLAVVCQMKLMYVASVIRHGARYPLSNMFDGNETKQFHGQLTSVGMRQHFLLGGYLKADYIDKLKLINQTLYPKQVQIFTDSSERCILSTMSHLMGLFPFGTGPHLPEGIETKYLNPPFQTVTKQNLKKQEILEMMTDFGLKFGFQPTPYLNATQFLPSCPNQNSLIEKRLESLAKQLAQFQTVHAAFTQKMRITFNLTAVEANVAGLVELYDVVVCDLNLGRQLPASFDQYDLKQLKYVQNYLFDLLYRDNMARVFSTPMVEGILGNMDNIVKNGDRQKIKYSIYSGHDVNIVPLLNFFNLTSPQCIKKTWMNETVKGNCAQVPPFASNLILELHSNDDNEGYFVKIRYNGKYLNVCGSTDTCNYQEFSERVQKQFVDWRKQCGVKGQEQKLLIDQ